MKQITAVEWVAEEAMNLVKQYMNGTLNEDTIEDNIYKIIIQGKEMEKEQNIDFARHCLNKAKDLDILTAFMNVQQYHNETFKSE